MANTDLSSAGQLAQIFRYLRTLRPYLTSIAIEYSGSGDSGDICGIDCDPKDLKDLLEDITLPGDIAASIGVSSVDCKSLFDELGWDAAYRHCPGFEINEGGQGIVTISWDEERARIMVEIDHENNVIETVSSSESFAF